MRSPVPHQVDHVRDARVGLGAGLVADFEPRPIAAPDGLGLLMGERDRLLLLDLDGLHREDGVVPDDVEYDGLIEHHPKHRAGAPGGGRALER